MKAFMEKQHFGEYHGKNEGVIYPLSGKDVRADVSSRQAVERIQEFCRSVGLPFSLEDGTLRIFRNMSNKQNFCYRFEIKTKEAPEVLEYDIPEA